MKKKRYSKRKRKSKMAFNLSGMKFKEHKCSYCDLRGDTQHILKMFMVSYRDCVVEVTIDQLPDGDLYWVRVNEGLPKLDIDYITMVEFVESETRKQER